MSHIELSWTAKKEKDEEMKRGGDMKMDLEVKLD